MRNGAAEKFLADGRGILFSSLGETSITLRWPCPVPEQRQYQLLAMKHDVVIDQPSPILTVVVS